MVLSKKGNGFELLDFNMQIDFIQTWYLNKRTSFVALWFLWFCVYYYIYPSLVILICCRYHAKSLWGLRLRSQRSGFSTAIKFIAWPMISYLCVGVYHGVELFIRVSDLCQVIVYLIPISSTFFFPLMKIIWVYYWRYIFIHIEI